MLDHAAVATLGGLTLWTQTRTPRPPPTDTLLAEHLAQGRTHGEADIGPYAVVWASHQQLVFLLAAPRLLSLPPYFRALLTAFVRSFTTQFSSIIDVLAARHVDMVAVDPLKLRRVIFAPADSAVLFPQWDSQFSALVHSAQAQYSDQHSRTDTSRPNAPPSNPPANASLHAKSMAVHKSGRKIGKQQHKPNTKDNNKDVAKQRKQARKWGADGLPFDSSSVADSASLDYSAPPEDADSSDGKMDLDENPPVSSDVALVPDSHGNLDIAPYSDARNSLDSDHDDDHVADGDDDGDSRVDALTRFFSSLGLSSRKLSRSEIVPAVNQMRDHLAKKNVARTICDQLVEPLANSLTGRTVSGRKALDNTIRDSLSHTLTSILTPATSTDILQDIQRKLRAKKDPYVFTFCGVNGVGKSTNLAKIAFWLLNNRYRILVAACDTFRSGAVEQLNVHVRNLQQLNFGGTDQTKMIELFQKGYGKDAAAIAASAISHAKENNFDIVLVDTAGRMQDNEPLMKALAKLVSQNNPDKVLFVAEALVGNQGLDQLVSFDNSLKSFSQSKQGEGRGVDGIMLTKFDTIDDKVGAAVSMTYTTGKPILFIGTGQTYSDLRSLKVDNVVRALMRD